MIGGGTIGSGSFGSTVREPGVEVGTPIQEHLGLLLVGTRNVSNDSPSIQVSMALGSRGRTTFRVSDPKSEIDIRIGETVRYSFDGQLIFGGEVERITIERPSLDTANTHRFIDVEAGDFSRIPARRIVSSVFEKQDAGEVVRSLFTSFLAPEGVTIGTIEAGFPVGPLSFDFEPVSSALDKIADLIGYTWRIDERKRLHFVSRDSVPAPFALAETSERAYRRISIETTRSGFRNIHVTRGAREVGAERVRRFAGDGETSSFSVELPVAEEPTILVNGAIQSVGVRGQDDERDEAGADWFFAEDETAISQNTSADPLRAGDVLEVRYLPLVPVVTLSRDDVSIDERRAIEGGTGIYEASSTERRVETAALAREIGDSKIRNNGIRSTIDLESFWFGWRPGQIITATLADEGIVGDWLVEDVSMREVGPRHLLHTIRALDSGKAGGWVDFFRRLAEQGAEFSFGRANVAGISQAADTILVSGDPTSTSGDGLGDPADDPYTVGRFDGKSVFGKSYLLEDGTELAAGSRIGASA